MNRVATVTSSGPHRVEAAVLYHGESEWCDPQAMAFEHALRPLYDQQIHCHVVPADVFAEPERYRTQLTHLADALEHASGSERVKLTKQQKKLQDQSLEIQKYEEKIHHLADQNLSIDLDDGVKHNYALFADVLAKIK